MRPCLVNMQAKRLKLHEVPKKKQEITRNAGGMANRTLLSHCECSARSLALEKLENDRGVMAWL